MKLWRLVWANLFRRKTRTLLTFMSIVTAYLLFGLLQSVNQILNSGADFVGATRLVTQARVSFTQPLPLRLKPQVQSVPGVVASMHSQWFGGIYQDPANFFPQFAVDPATLFEVYPEWVLPDEQKQAFQNGRAVTIVGKRLVERFGWKIGDVIPLNSTIWTRRDGSSNWEFEIVGIFDGKDEDWQRRAGFAYLNFEYFNEERSFGKGNANTFVSRISDIDGAAEIASTIDQMFENSPEETKTQSERDFQVGFLRQIGDIGQIVRWILFAVFFALLLVVGQTMAQSFNERVPELAILKTLGFGDGQVMWLVLTESLVICILGACCGLALSYAAGVVISSTGQFPPVQDEVLVIGAISALLMGLLVGAIPAWRALSLRIVDALAGR